MEALQLYGKVSYCCSEYEGREAQELAVLLSKYLSDRSAMFIRERSDLPLLQFYSNDGTPIKLHFQVKKSVGGANLRRAGKTGKELLVQVTFLRYMDSEGAAQSRVSFPPPLPLTKGKTALAIFSMSQKYWKSLREQGHRGIAIQQVCFDRANFSALARLFDLHHQSQKYAHHQSWAVAEWHSLQEWVEGVPCSLHDAHNSLNGGLEFPNVWQGGPQECLHCHPVAAQWVRPDRGELVRVAASACGVHPSCGVCLPREVVRPVDSPQC